MLQRRNQPLQWIVSSIPTALTFQRVKTKLMLFLIFRLTVYVNFIQPFWKVRIGNFKTVEEAKAYKEELVKQFPELQAESYPVKDMIIIKK